MDSCSEICAYANRQHALCQEVTSDPRESSPWAERCCFMLFCLPFPSISFGFLRVSGFFRALTLSEGVLLILDEARGEEVYVNSCQALWIMSGKGLFGACDSFHRSLSCK